jgi:hypothetical protein
MKRKCNVCRLSYEAQRPTSKFCSPNCRATNARTAPMSWTPVHPVPPASASIASITPTDSSLVKAIRSELDAAGVADTASGQQALRLATQLSGYDTASGMAALSRELSRVMAETLRVAVSLMADPVDELAARRDAKLAGS